MGARWELREGGNPVISGGVVPWICPCLVKDFQTGQMGGEKILRSVCFADIKIPVEGMSCVWHQLQFQENSNSLS